MSTLEEIGRIAETIHSRMEEQGSPYRDLLFRLMQNLGGVNEVLNQISSRWRQEYLEKAKAHDKTNPPGQDYEDYAKPIIVPAEMLRAQKFYKDLAHHLYLHVVDVTDRHCARTGVDLHRGALYADLGITYFERRQFELGLSWLLGAANEDVRFHRVADIYGSHALSNDGIYGQWVQTQVMPAIPAAVLDFVNAQLGTAYGFPDVMRFLRSLAGQGDLNLLSGIVNFADVEGRDDYVGHSVRFNCLRDLATLTEVLLKRVGVGHADPAVRGKYAHEQMFGGMIFHMHYLNGPRHANVALRAAKSEGLFWNSVRKQNDLIAGIDAGFDSVKLAGGLTVDAVRGYLNGTVLTGDANSDALAKRFLLSYRLRNETSHSFQPSNTGMVNHAAEFRTWLLQTIFYSYFWFRDTAQATF